MGPEPVVMTSVSRSFFLEVGIALKKHFEIYTLSTYANVVSYGVYANHKYDIYMVAREKRFHEIKYFAWI